MVDDTVLGGQCIGMALLKKGWETDYYGNPPVFGMGCIGRLVSVQPLADGCSNILLQGLERFEIATESHDKPYRQAAITLRPRSEKRRQERMAERADYILLTSVPGVGRVLATMILLETGPIDRFPSIGDFASYARCMGSERTSNGKKKGEGNAKNGNKYLSWAFIEAAAHALQNCAQAKRFYERKKTKTNGVVAMKSLAHKRRERAFTS